MQDRKLEPARVDGFDLTPAMLERFQLDITKQRLKQVRLMTANVLELETLPYDWCDYDLVISSAMLEYLPKESLPVALAALRSRLNASGSMIIFISRRNVLMQWLIARWWNANLYSKDELVDAFHAARLEPTFCGFPAAYRHLDLWGFVVTATPLTH